MSVGQEDGHLRSVIKMFAYEALRHRTPLPDALPYTMRFGTTSLTKSTGSAKLTPLLRPVPCLVKVAVLMPTRRALLSSKAPPELPALMEASVCSRASFQRVINAQARHTVIANMQGMQYHSEDGGLSGHASGCCMYASQ